MSPTIHNVRQGTEEWLRLRLGRPTASELNRLITPKKLQPATGDAVNTYVCEKVTEKWWREPLRKWSGDSAEQGTLKEKEARPFYEYEYGTKVQTVGFVTGADGRCGCSPDGLIGEDSGLEIKCPERQTHVRYLLEGVLPSEYAPQVHGSMFVTGRSSWVFMSYCRDIDPFVIRVERDEAVMSVIREALAGFYQRFDAAMAKLKPREAA